MPKSTEVVVIRPHANRPRTVFLSIVAVLGLFVSVLLFTLPSPWREICVALALVGVVVIIPASRIWANHYAYQLAKLEGRAAPIGGAMSGGNGWGVGESKPTVKPVFINQNERGGRYVLR